MYNRACDVDGCNVWKCAEPLLSTKQNSIRFRRIHVFRVDFVCFVQRAFDEKKEKTVTSLNPGLLSWSSLLTTTRSSDNSNRNFVKFGSELTTFFCV